MNEGVDAGSFTFEIRSDCNLLFYRLALGCTVRLVDVVALNLLPKGDAADWMAANPEAIAADIAALPSIDATTSPTGTETGDADRKQERRTLAETATHRCGAETCPAFDADTLLPDALRVWIMDEAERMPCPPRFHRGGCAGGARLHHRRALRHQAQDARLVADRPESVGRHRGRSVGEEVPRLGAALKPLDRLIAMASEAHAAALADYETDEGGLRCAEGRH